MSLWTLLHLLLFADSLSRDRRRVQEWSYPKESSSDPPSGIVVLLSLIIGVGLVLLVGALLSPLVL